VLGSISIGLENEGTHQTGNTGMLPLPIVKPSWNTDMMMEHTVLASQL